MTKIRSFEHEAFLRMRSPSRAGFLGAGTATALIGSSLLGDFVLAASKADPNDLATLNAAIQLERAGIKAYDDAAATGLLSGRVLAVALGFRSDHMAHRDALIAAVNAGGGVPTTETAHLDYPKLATRDDILRFAVSVEEKAASTYLSVIPDFVDRTLAQVAAAILGVETTHVALLSEALGAERPYPSAFVV